MFDSFEYLGKGFIVVYVYRKVSGDLFQHVFIQKTTGYHLGNRKVLTLALRSNDDHGHHNHGYGQLNDGCGHHNDEHGHSNDDHGQTNDDHGHYNDNHGHYNDDHGHYEDDHGDYGMMMVSFITTTLRTSHVSCGVRKFDQGFLSKDASQS